TTHTAGRPPQGDDGARRVGAVDSSGRCVRELCARSRGPPAEPAAAAARWELMDARVREAPARPGRQHLGTPANGSSPPQPSASVHRFGDR
ncbi:hypothetical protein, partial [Streptomyces sp. XH2]|uniref:hypothetical protein n=1 Tax=Streptomyces sp. XH2 TaxID=3412483 RepID=UPI003C7D3FA3